MSRCRWIARLLPCHPKVQLELWFHFNVMIFKIYRIDKDVRTKNLYLVPILQLWKLTKLSFSKCGPESYFHITDLLFTFVWNLDFIWATSSSVCQMPNGPPWIASGFNKAADEGRIFDEEKFRTLLRRGLMDVSTWIMQCHWHVMPNKTTQKRQPVSFKVYRKKTRYVSLTATVNTKRPERYLFLPPL